MPTLYHITDYAGKDNVDIAAGTILHLTPDTAWYSWGRDNDHKSKPSIYKIQVPWSGVTLENERYIAKQTLHDAVLSPYRPDTNPAEISPVDRAYTTTRRRKPPEDRFTSKDPYISLTPPAVNTEPPGRILRGPHNLNMMDMVRSVAHIKRRLQRLANKMRK